MPNGIGLDLFTGTTWDEFQKAGAHVSGFREHNRKRASKVHPGDVFLCYLTGVKRWVGLLEATSEIFKDDKQIWDMDVFPVRFKVKPLVMLTPENGVPMEKMRGKLSFFPADCLPGGWSGWVRGSPTKYEKQDGETIAAAIREAARQEGFRQGLAAGEAAGREQLSQSLADLERLAGEMQAAQERYWQEIRPELVRLAMAVAGRIVREEIGLRPEVLEGILDEALAEGRELGRLTLRLHPADYGVLFARLQGKTQNGEPLEVRPDAGLSPGDLVVEGENGTVDARISRQLERLERSLGAVL